MIFNIAFTFTHCHISSMWTMCVRFKIGRTIYIKDNTKCSPTQTSFGCNTKYKTTMLRCCCLKVKNTVELVFGFTVYVAENMFCSDSCLIFLSIFECVHLCSPTLPRSKNVVVFFSRLLRLVFACLRMSCAQSKQQTTNILHINKFLVVSI